VRDTGIGIPENKIGLLFDKFSQVDASTTRRFGGTGLGLAISKQLVELMGGEVGVNSKEGQGSNFWFTVRMGRHSGKVQSEKHSPANLHNVKVLIVDDNPTNLEILTTRTASWGMRPYETNDGPGALKALYQAADENDPFRIAIIDMQMPDMDGEMLGLAIRSDTRLADTRMVMMTSVGTRGDARHFQQLGFAAYLTKPAKHQELKVILSLALTNQDDVESMTQTITTRHTARETIKKFNRCNTRILVAEDNITNQQVALGILRKLGLQADAVADGAEAIRALETIAYDLVLMDVQMPVMDGLKATKKIRHYEFKRMKDKKGRKNETHLSSNLQSSPIGSRRLPIPIIAMTAHAMQGDRERCLEAGMNDYLSKPVAPKALAELLNKWLPEKDEEITQSTEKCGTQSAKNSNDEKTNNSFNSSHSPQSAAPLSLRTYHSEPTFDRVAMMEQMMDDEDLAKEIADAFLEDTPQQIETLRNFLKAGNIRGVERQAHSIKGSSANVGAKRLSAIAYEMEKVARNEDSNPINAYMEELKTELNCFKQALRNELYKC
jgi:CheY-like chemotaxis protein/HPt (histidine-containing phosphotransfer) domain-containing protein